MVLLVVVSHPPRVSLALSCSVPHSSVPPLRGGGPKLHGQGADLHSATQGTIQEVLGTVASEFPGDPRSHSHSLCFAFGSVVPRRYLHSFSVLS